MTVQQTLEQLIERQVSDETRLRRIVALFQRSLGAVFGNAAVKRRNRRYEINVAVYERPARGGHPYRMPDRQIKEWVRQAAESAHPRLYKRLRVDVSPWRTGRVSHKLFAEVKIYVDAAQTSGR